METLVTHGHRATGLFDVRPTRVNPLDAFPAPRRAVQRLRLKEWIGWTFMHPELSASMILQDANYLASSEIYVRDAVSQRLTQHSASARGGSLKLPEAFYGSSPRIVRPGYRIAYDLGPLGGTHRLHVDIAAKGDEPAIRAELELDGAGSSAPLSVSQPLLPRGQMYTHKLVFPVSGSLSVGEHTYEFRADRDLVILDEHKTFLPYRTHWLWGTFAVRHEDGIVGANFCERPDAPGTPGESCLWLPDPSGRPACIGLDEVAFVAESDEPLARWHGFSHDGLLDVTFTPDGRKDVKHQLLVAAIDYWQLYGTWSGTVAGRRVTQVRGVMEKMDARL
ncbi:MAG: DUF2804 family protein [Nocardioides sp.]